MRSCAHTCEKSWSNSALTATAPQLGETSNTSGHGSSCGAVWKGGKNHCITVLKKTMEVFLRSETYLYGMSISETFKSSRLSHFVRLASTKADRFILREGEQESAEDREREGYGTEPKHHHSHFCHDLCPEW